MKLPNGYGSVVKLPGSRRRPFAVRISYMQEQPDGTSKRTQKCIAYFAKKEQALSFLADYNNGAVVNEHMKYSQSPTFAEMLEKWKTYKNSLKKKPGASTWKNYDIAFNFFAPLHDKKMISIRAQDLQECLTSKNSKSRSTVGSMRAVIRGMWSYAVANEYVDTDITQHLIFEYTDNDAPIHTRFTDKEIMTLWDNVGVINNVDIILIYIYTGCRPTELLEIKSEDVHLDKKYMIGGIKTEAGKNRIIPLHNAIIPLVERRLEQKRPYLISNKYGNHYTRAVYHASNWQTCINKLGFNHAPHDCRYTFAALADSVCMNEICKKLIMGHALANKSGTAFKIGGSFDVTRDVYTEKTLDELIEAVNLLPTSF